MPYKVTHDLCVKVGTRTDRETGEEKGRYQNVGRVMKNEEGNVLMMLNKTFNPAGVPADPDRDSIILSMFKKEPRQQQAPAAAPSGGDFDDDIPF